ncbi:MAG: hypothetical protein R2795_23960 [Saprospiraceae bacterium]
MTQGEVQVAFLESTDASSVILVSDGMGRELSRYPVGRMKKGQTFSLDLTQYVGGQYWLAPQDMIVAESQRIIVKQ